MDGLMATNPYTKRVAQGAAQGALAGGTAGFMLGGPVGGVAGLAVGGLAGGLLSRPGDDERRLRARMRKLEMGVLGDEEAAIMNRFMDPVRGAAQQQEVSRRALEQGTVTSGAAARRAQAAQRGARQDLREAAQEGTLAVMDLGERRRMQAQRINERLLGEEARRDQAFRQGMVSGAVNAAGLVGGALGQKRALGDREAALLPGGAANAADVAAMSDDELLERYTAGLPPIDFDVFPEAADPVPTTPSPVTVPGLGQWAEAGRQARARLAAVDNPPVEAVAAPAPAVAPARAGPPVPPAGPLTDDEYMFLNAIGMAPPDATVTYRDFTPDERLLHTLGVYRPLTEAERLGETVVSDPMGESVDAERQLALNEVIAAEARQLEAEGRAADYAVTQDPDYWALRRAYPGFTPADVADMMDTYKQLDEHQRQAMLDDYGYYLEYAQEL